MIFWALQMHIKKGHDGTEVNYKIFQLLKGWKKSKGRGDARQEKLYVAVTSTVNKKEFKF
jgi:hypothetical protein